MKSKGEKERCTHLNAEFQRIVRRDKKAFLSDQCKEIEENNRIGKTGDLFKKIRDTKGIVHAKMGTIKDRNGMDLTEAQDIKKRWQEYTEELYKKDLHDQDNHDTSIKNRKKRIVIKIMLHKIHYLLDAVKLFVIPRTIGCQSPLSMEFFRQNYWSGLPFKFLGLNC